jgi:hypothetical protein
LAQGSTTASPSSSPFAAVDRLLSELRQIVHSVEPQGLLRRRPQVSLAETAFLCSCHSYPAQ